MGLDYEVLANDGAGLVFTIIVICSFISRGLTWVGMMPSEGGR